MISITRSTSITSMSGVVLMSIMTSGSRAVMPELGPTFIAMLCSWTPCSRSSLTSTDRRLGDETDFGDPCALARVDDPSDALVARSAVAADLHFRLRRQHRDLLQPIDQRRGVLHAKVVPVDAPLLVDREREVLRLGLADLVALLWKLDRNRGRNDRNREEEED